MLLIMTQVNVLFKDDIFINKDWDFKSDILKEIIMFKVVFRDRNLGGLVSLNLKRLESF